MLCAKHPCVARAKHAKHAADGRSSDGFRPSMEVCCHTCSPEDIDMRSDRLVSTADAHTPHFSASHFRGDYGEYGEYGRPSGPAPDVGRTSGTGAATVGGVGSRPRPGTPATACDPRGERRGRRAWRPPAGECPCASSVQRPGGPATFRSGEVAGGRRLRRRADEPAELPSVDGSSVPRPQATHEFGALAPPPSLPSRLSRTSPCSGGALRPRFRSTRWRDRHDPSGRSRG
jgi:hypothetical protein